MELFLAVLQRCMKGAEAQSMTSSSEGMMGNVEVWFCCIISVGTEVVEASIASNKRAALMLWLPLLELRF